MSYDALETSQRAGEPVELFRFASGARVWYLTSADEELVHLSDTYTPDAITRGAVRENEEEADSGSVSVSLPRTHPIAQLFIGYVPEPPMSLLILQRHRTDAGVNEVFRGTITSFRTAGAVIELLGEPDISAYDQLIPRNTCQPQCNWALYSDQCGVARASFFVSGPVSVVSGFTVQATAFAGKPDGWLNNGYLERASGERRYVVSHVGTTVTLLSPFLDLVPGEIVLGQAGCDRTEAVCDTKFNNHARFLGFPRVPTKNPFDVGVG